MAFGDSAGAIKNTPKATAPTGDIFLKLVTAEFAEVRIVGNEVIFKEYWYKERPVIGGVLDVELGEFVGADGDNYYNNPMQDAVNALPDGDAKTKRFAKTRFVVNVFDRKANAMKILNQSAGKEGGKHFLGQLVAMNGNGALLSRETGKPLKITETDLRIITSQSDPKNPLTITRMIVQGLNVDPFVPTQMYDLQSWIKPWPVDAMQEYLDGADYNEVRAKYGLTAFPTLKDV